MPADERLVWQEVQVGQADGARFKAYVRAVVLTLEARRQALGEINAIKIPGRQVSFVCAVRVVCVIISVAAGCAAGNASGRRARVVVGAARACACVRRASRGHGRM